MNIQEINNSIQEERSILLNHSLYAKITTISDLHVFLEGHVYAVWDFMSLLKALQQHLTCTTIPWFASQNPETRYLINEIVLAEESDLTLDGRRLSHFEMYLEAMKKCNADTYAVLDFIASAKFNDIFVSIENTKLHPNIKAFLNFTFTTIKNGKAHEIAAAFTFGREDLIPNMFTEILNELKNNFPETNLEELIYYFERHIELDADEHGPMAFKMIDDLCGNDVIKWKEVAIISKQALQMRIKLWDAIADTLN